MTGVYRWRWRRLVVTLVLAAVVAVPAAAKEARVHGQGLLFRVTAAAIAPSHVYGTMHSTDPEVLNLPPVVARAFGRSTRLVLEIVFAPDFEAHLQAAMRLSDGRTLLQIVGPELYARLRRRVAAYGVPPEYVNDLKPWGAGMLLSLPVSEVDRRAAGAIALDRALQQAADERGIRVYGLETVAEQIAAFEDYSEEDQVESLRMSVELNPLIDSLFADMKKAYLAGDLDGLHDMARSIMAGRDQRLADLFEKRMVELRNRRMANRLARHVKLGGAFVAIGALHLSGENGVLRLLERRGYSVKRVY